MTREAVDRQSQKMGQEQPQGSRGVRPYHYYYQARTALRATAKSAVKMHPALEGAAALLYRGYVRARAARAGQWQDPFEIYWVNPSRITRSLDGLLDRSGDTGKVLSGDWDLGVVPISGMPVYSAFEDRFRHGRAWTDTDYYRQILHMTLYDRQPWTRWRNPAEFDERLRYWDRLFDTIQRDGYKTQNELSPQHKFRLATDDEIAIRIDRHGRPLVESGLHRLLMAQILGLGQIPVTVTARHREWQRFADEVRSHGRRHGFPQPLTHFDLSGLYDGPADGVVQLLTSNLPDGCRSILNLGARWGYYCHRLEDLGVTCAAVEPDEADFHFLARLRAAEERRFSASRDGIPSEVGAGGFDAVLLQAPEPERDGTRDRVERLTRVLRDAKTPVAFYVSDSRSLRRPGLDETPGRLDGSALGDDRREMVRAALAAAGLARWEHVGDAGAGQPVFKATAG